MSLLCVFATVCAVYMWQKMRKRHYCMSVCIVIQLGSAAPKWHKITYCRVDIQCSSTLKSRELNTHNEAISSSFFPLLRCLFIFIFFTSEVWKWRSKVTFLTVNFIFFKLVFLLCFRLSTLTSLCVTSQRSNISWRTIAKTLTVDTTRKCFKFSLFCFCSSQKVYFIFNLLFLFWWWLFQIKQLWSKRKTSKRNERLHTK